MNFWIPPSSIAFIMSFLSIWISEYSTSRAQFTENKYGSTKCTQPRALIQPNLEWIQEGVERHNYYRRLHGAPPLTLNLQLCQISQAWANERSRGVKGHNPNRCRLGENIHTFWTSGELGDRNASSFVDDWYNEIDYYDYKTGQAKDGYRDKVVGHFTQVVWNSSIEIGMAATRYYKTEADGVWEYIVVVANYYPPQNQYFKENVISNLARRKRAKLQLIVACFVQFSVVLLLL